MATAKKKVPAKKAAAKKAAKKAPAAKAETPAATSGIPASVQEFLKQTSVPKGFVNAKQITLPELRNRVTELSLSPTVPLEQLLAAANRIKPAPIPVEKLPDDIKASIPTLKP